MKATPVRLIFQILLALRKKYDKKQSATYVHNKYNQRNVLLQEKLRAFCGIWPAFWLKSAVWAGIFS